MNKAVPNAYNIWFKVLRGGNLDGVKEIQYYSSGFSVKEISEPHDDPLLLPFSEVYSGQLFPRKNKWSYPYIVIKHIIIVPV